MKTEKIKRSLSDLLLASLFTLPFLNPIHQLPNTSFHSEAIAYWIAAVLFAVVLSGYDIFKRANRVIAWSLYAGALIQSVVVFWQSHKLGLTGQPNHTSAYIAMGLVSLCFLDPYKRPYTSLVSAAVLIAALIFLRSYFIILSFVVIAFFLTKRSILLYIVAVVLLLAIMFKDNSMTRLYLFTEAMNAFASSPLTGIGLGNFKSYADGQVATNSHNLIMQLLAECGLVGIAILSYLVYVWYKYRQDNTYLYCILLIILTHSMVEFPLYYLYFLLPFFFLLAAASRISIIVLLTSFSFILGFNYYVYVTPHAGVVETFKMESK